MPRPRWMGRLPFLRNRRCSDCGMEFGRLARVIPLRTETAKTLVKLWVIGWLAGAFVALALAIGAWFSWRHGHP